MPQPQQEWPWQYSFPPFFTLQPHPETRAKQVAAWKTLILNYCKRTKTFILEIGEASSLTLFNNTAINRKLDTSVIISILGELQKSGNAASIDKSKYRWEIYWHTPEEWASKIYNYISSNGMQNSIVTLFELTQGDDAKQEDFYSMPQDMFVKILRYLERDRKCEVILEDDIQGVKFF